MDWSWSSEAIVPLVLAAGYLAATAPGGDAARARRVRRRLRAARRSRSSTPLDTLAREYLVWGHLLQNVVLAEWAPLLLVLGIPPALGRAARAPAAVRLLTLPVVALPLWVATYAVWHVPALYDAALRHPHTLLAARARHVPRHRHAVLVVRLAGRAAPAPVGRARRVRVRRVRPLGAARPRARARPEPLYDFYAGAPERVWGLSRLEDQQLGGMTMAAEQSIVFFVVFAYWFLRFLAEQEHGRRPTVTRVSP